MHYRIALAEDGTALAELRAQAMKASLMALGRYDEQRVRRRFLDTFVPQDTRLILREEALLGFYVLRQRDDHYYLDHLYVQPQYQGEGIGGKVLTLIIQMAREHKLPVRLGALRGSPANDFYRKNGFRQTHEDEFDIYYEYSIDSD